MGKLLLVLLVVVLVGAVVWTWRRSNAVTSSRAPRLSTIVACAHCGVHIPVSEALMLDSQPYCCIGHRESGPRDPA